MDKKKWISLGAGIATLVIGILVTVLTRAAALAEGATTGDTVIFALGLILIMAGVLVGVVGLLLLPFGVNLFNMDVDFLGGVTMTFDMGEAVDTALVEDIASEVLDRGII